MSAKATRYSTLWNTLPLYLPTTLTHNLFYLRSCQEIGISFNNNLRSDRHYLNVSNRACLSSLNSLAVHYSKHRWVLHRDLIPFSQSWPSCPWKSWTQIHPNSLLWKELPSCGLSYPFSFFYERLRRTFLDIWTLVKHSTRLSSLISCRNEC